ncbi:hypothetical protein WR25_22708 [Diploscapter pachys]|uniref:C3H1-type domain-containing protein n=1 Tax=Diploscapter pachys TaxID=2018661 RepID=A0A2A2M0U7_9BILA|nr:hypothetical protein WR25_22708 [Diploscapter pachys]
MPLFQYHSTSSPTEALSSLLDPFAASPTADPSLNITHLTGVPYRQMNGVAVNRYANSPMARRQFEPPTSLTPFGSPLTPNPNPLNGRCQYAHGEQEKRPIPRHPKYKTEACQPFHQTGLCPYGPRCHFIHNETELLANMTASSPIGSTISTPLSHSMSSKPTPVPNNVALVQRMCSLPGYASTGDSAGSSSSADSGSESPNGSFSPGLELDENVGFMAMPYQQQQQRRTPQRFLSYEAPKAGVNREVPLNGLLNDIISWTLEDAPTGVQQQPQQQTSSSPIDAVSGARWEEPGARLPVFAQLSNPQ